MTDVIYELQHHSLSLDLDPLFLLYSLLILLIYFIFSYKAQCWCYV